MAYFSSYQGSTSPSLPGYKSFFESQQLVLDVVDNRVILKKKVCLHRALKLDSVTFSNNVNQYGPLSIVFATENLWTLWRFCTPNNVDIRLMMNRNPVFFTTWHYSSVVCDFVVCVCLTVKSRQKPKRQNIGSRKQRPGTLVFYAKNIGTNPTGSPPTGALNSDGVG